MAKAVILVSGGISSAVAAAAAREQYEPALLHVAWGHRSAERELTCFGHLAPALKIEQARVIELAGLALFGGNARVSKRLPLDEAGVIHSETPASFMLGLLPSMLSLAATWAAAINATRIIVGISENHATSATPISELYPDHRREFIQAFNLMLAYGKPRQRDLLVEAPLLELTRTEVVKLGHVLNVPFAQTWSCYAGNDEPCGNCLGCAARATGFIQAGLPDPLLLQPATR